MSEIKEYSRSDGFTIIPNEFAQNRNLSLEAKGLLTELTSHSKNYKIYKTQLHRNSKKNSRHKIDKAWKELEDEGYLLAFKKINGKGYKYEYIFSTEKFSRDEVNKLIVEYKDLNYILHTKILNIELHEQQNSTVSNISTVENVDLKGFPTVLNDNSVGITVSDQQLINKNKINTNEISVNESYESEYDDLYTKGQAVDNSSQTEESIEKSFTNKKNNFTNNISKISQSPLFNDTRDIEHAILNNYINILPEKILVFILQLIGNNLKQCEMIIQNILKSKTQVSKVLKYSIHFEEMNSNQINSLANKIKHIVSRLNKEQFIAQYGEISNPEAFCFTTFKNFFLEEYEYVNAEKVDSDVDSDTVAILTQNWLQKIK